MEVALYGIYIIIMFLVSIFQTLFFGVGVEYKYKNIPDYKVGIIEHNLESTPIYDILSGEQCEDYSKTSNILGYYFGYDKGFKYDSKSYTSNESSICYENDYCYYFDAHRDLIIEYKYFKGVRLCTSKRPNKNYFDYLQFSIGINETCKKGTKKCGKLDVNRILCVNEGEKCPINDIVYNTQSNYTKDNITYEPVKINIGKEFENEYIHYTNVQTENFIITNLTIIGGGGSAFPCGSNDNDKFDSISAVDINKYCEGNETNFTYYFFNKLSSVQFEQFYNENNLSLIDLPEYHYYIYSRENMMLFSTGYFSLSEEDIKIIKKPSDINKNNNYCKIVSKFYKVGFAFVVVLGVSFPIILMGIYGEAIRSECNIPQIIVNCIVISICLIIIICGIMQMIMIKQLYFITSYIPDFLFNNEVKNIMSEKVGFKYFLAYLFVLIFQIPFLVMNIYYKFKKGRENSEKKKALVKEEEKNTELTLKNESDVTPDTPQPSDNWIQNTPY